jgi:hypothetical protein
MDSEILKACKELIDDVKVGCADLVFKETCLEVLSKASSILSSQEFKQLVAYVEKRITEKIPFDIQRQLTIPG